MGCLPTSAPCRGGGTHGHDRARLALRLYVDRIRAAIGALTVTMGGLDALVFTAGVGEHSAWLRGEVCHGLECLGVRLDAAANGACQPDADIAAAGSGVRVLVLHTREELLIAREAVRVGGVYVSACSPWEGYYALPTVSGLKRKHRPRSIRLSPTRGQLTM